MPHRLISLIAGLSLAALAGAAAASEVVFSRLSCEELTPQGQAALASSVATAELAAEVKLYRGPDAERLATRLCAARGAQDCPRDSSTDSFTEATFWRSVHALAGDTGIRIILSRGDTLDVALGVATGDTSWMDGRACAEASPASGARMLSIDRDATFILVAQPDGAVTLFWSRDPAQLAGLAR